MEFQNEIYESNKTQYKLLDWISQDNLCFDHLSLNPKAIDLLKKNPKKIYWGFLSANPGAEDLILENENKIWTIFLLRNSNPKILPLIEKQLSLIELDKIRYGSEDEPILHDFININVDDFVEFAENPSAIDLVQKYVNLIHERTGYSEIINSMILGFCNNPNPDVIPILEKYIDKFTYHEWFYLCQNPAAMSLIMSLIEKNKDNIMWNGLSANSNATRILEENKDEIDWDYLSLNTHPTAIQWLEENQEKINWDNLSKNKSAIHILKENQDKINWENFSTNQGIFEKI